MEHKNCTLCFEEKPISDFSFRKQRQNWNSYCKECGSLRNMQRDYGVSPQTYKTLLAAQGHRCAICDSHEDDVAQRGNKYRLLCVDHDHSTGQVRGLLCHNCNVMLGHAKDGIKLLHSAIAYLETHKESNGSLNDH